MALPEGTDAGIVGDLVGCDLLMPHPLQSPQHLQLLMNLRARVVAIQVVTLDSTSVDLLPPHTVQLSQDLHAFVALSAHAGHGIVGNHVQHDPHL